MAIDQAHAAAVAQITLTTVILTAGGQITCRRCNDVTMVAPGAVVLWDNGQKSRVETVDYELLHRCGRQLEWYCFSCNSTDGYWTGRGWQKAMKCSLCFDAMLQRPKRPT